MTFGGDFEATEASLQRQAKSDSRAKRTTSQAERERERNARLVAQLRALGIEPES